MRWPSRQPVGDPNDPRGWDVLIARFLEWRDVHNYSQKSRGGFDSVLRLFARWSIERGILRPAEVSREAIERYQRYLFHFRTEEGRPLAVSSQRARLSYVKAFFRWLARERYLLYNPAAEIVLPREHPRLPVDTYSLEEMERILSTPDTTKLLGLRDRALLEVLYSTGIRRGEAANLDVYDVVFERGWLVVRQGKGGKDRVVPIGERALHWVSRYLEESRPHLLAHPDELALFVNNAGVRFDLDGLGNRVAKILDQSGVRRRRGCCHLFRHTMATQMLERGADIRYIQQILGHSKLDTTEIYTRVEIHKLKEIHTATHPAKLERDEALREELLAALTAEATTEG